MILVNTNDFEGPGASYEQHITPDELVQCWAFVQACDYDDSAAWVWIVMHFGLKPWIRREDTWRKRLTAYVDRNWVSDYMLKNLAKED